MHDVKTSAGNGVWRKTPDAKLVCEGITKRYGDFVALKPVDLALPAGEFLTLLGPSGSGKTTLLMLVAGLLDADGGAVHIDGHDATRLPSHARDIGMVFQSYALFPHMTVFENIAFPLRMRRWEKERIAKAVDETLELVRLPQYRTRFPRELSGGQQQRVALARAIVYRPSIVLMDEPLGALDKKLRDHMQFELKQLQRDLNATVLYVTHDQDEAMAMSDRICLMNAGGIEQIGKPDELYFDPVSRFAADFLGESNLLPAQVTVAGAAPIVSFGGREFRPRAPGGAVSKAGPATLMVRPERIVVSLESGKGFAGTVTMSTLLGGAIRCALRLDDGTEMVTKTLTDGHRPAFLPGTRVRADWPDDACVVLEHDRIQTPEAP